MVKMSDDNLLIRSTAWTCFWITSFILFYCEAYTLFLLYISLAVSLVFGEQTVDEIHQFDTLRRYEHL